MGADSARTPESVYLFNHKSAPLIIGDESDICLTRIHHYLVSVGIVVTCRCYLVFLGPCYRDSLALCDVPSVTLEVDSVEHHVTVVIELDVSCVLKQNVRESELLVIVTGIGMLLFRIPNTYNAELRDHTQALIRCA